jgi:hypothetical protein
MQYTKPQITNVAEAHHVIQGSLNKGAFTVPDNNIHDKPCSQSAYEADE